MAEKEYQKLPGSGVRTGGLALIRRSLCTLYLASDHLLQVDSIGGFTEEYKRFYFHDIQAITIRKTQTAAMALSGAAVFAGLFALMGSASGDPVFSGIFYVLSGVLGFISLILAVLFGIRGGSCICHIQTAVQTEQLPSLKRLKTARKVLGIIQPLIEQAQGNLSPEELAGLATAALQTPVPPRIGAVPKSTSASNPPVNRSYSGRVHTLLFVMLLVEAAVACIHLVYHPVWFVALEMFVGFAFSGLLIVALLKQQGSTLSADVRKTTWSAFGLVGLKTVSAFVLTMVNIASNPDSTGSQLELLELYSQLDPFQNVWWMVLLLLAAGYSMVLGTLGLLFLKRWRDQNREPSIDPVDQSLPQP